MALKRVPICPHCDKSWEDGPASREFEFYDVIYCPHCAKVIAVLPIKQEVIDRTRKAP
jgi:hydrogenase maturation factor HypF (carbamoyltransferase family)